MNAIRYLAPPRRATTLLGAGPVRVAVSDDPADIVAAQRLRYRVFVDEPGFSDRIGDPRTGLDADRFDSFCEHLVVHEAHGLIGCARLLAPARAIAAGGWYSSTEFDLREFDDIASATVELGRAYVDSRHRDGSVTALMWAALLQYTEQTGHRYLMGCVSVPLYSPGESEPGAVLGAVRDRLRRDHRHPDPDGVSADRRPRRGQAPRRHRAVGDARHAAAPARLPPDGRADLR